MKNDEVLFETPILFLIFNRPNNANIVFNQIRKIKPSKLFVAADGPRKNVEEDLQKCLETRKILEKIDWDCQVQTLFQDKNLGCGLAVSRAIKWFFNNVEEGIILEDDCVPNLSFFKFCSFCLEKYRYKKHIMMISGNSFLFDGFKYSEDYFFSNSYSIWGWATWRRAWNSYDYQINDWKNFRENRIAVLRKIFKNYDLVKYWTECFDSVINNRVDTWDYQWCYNCIFNEGVSVTPIVNLVSNIGFIGAHANGASSVLNIPTKEIDLTKIKKPKTLDLNVYLSELEYKNLGVLKSYGYKYKMFIMSKLRKVFHFYKNIRMLFVLFQICFFYKI